MSRNSTAMMRSLPSECDSGSRRRWGRWWPAAAGARPSWPSAAGSGRRAARSGRLDGASVIASAGCGGAGAPGPARCARGRWSSGRVRRTPRRAGSAHAADLEQRHADRRPHRRAADVGDLDPRRADAQVVAHRIDGSDQAEHAGKAVPDDRRGSGQRGAVGRVRPARQLLEVLLSHGIGDGDVGAAAGHHEAGERRQRQGHGEGQQQGSEMRR